MGGRLRNIRGTDLYKRLAADVIKRTDFNSVYTSIRTMVSD